MKARTRQVVTTYGMAMLIGLAVLMTAIFGALAVYQGDAAREQNCEAIERHKAFHREESAFDLKATRAILADLNIDPDSDRGQHLIDTGRENADRKQARFAAEEC